MTADAYLRAQAGQRAAADPHASVFVTANAGSGKTKVLIDRVARLLLAGGSPSAFLCITYTKAAAAEMQRRLFDRLGAWCVKENEALRKELRELVGADLDDSQLARARALFARALETPGGLRIQTIHAFCERLLRRFPLEAGAPPGFTIAEEPLIAALTAQALLKTAQTQGAALAHFAKSLHEEALMSLMDEITRRRGELYGYLHTAGGLGAARTKIRARHGAKQDRVAFVRDFARATPWPDLRSAVETLRASGANDQDCAARIAEADASGDLDDYFGIFFNKQGEPRANVITRGLAQKNAFLDKLFNEERARAIAGKQQLLGIDRAEDATALLTLADALLTTYTKAKKEIGALDFDDLIERAQALLNGTDAAPWVLYKLDYGIQHILIDEGQDTSPAQWALIEPLQKEFFAGLSAREQIRTMFAVGDPKQSIYSFQGADPDRFLNEAQALSKRAAAAERDFVAPQLSMSFRSAQQILDAVDATFAMLPLSAGVAGTDIPKHIARREAETGLVEWWPLARAPERTQANPWSAPFDHQSGATASTVLCNAVAAKIGEWIKSGEAVWDKDGPRPMHAGDVLILVRKRGAIFEDMLRTLKSAGLDVAGADRMVLRNELAVEDLLALIRVALDPRDDLSLAAALKGPFIGLGEDDLIALAAGRQKDERLIERLRTATTPAHAAAAAYVEAVIAARHSTPYEFLARILETTDANDDSGWKRMFARLGEAARDPVEELLTRAQSIGDRGAPSLHHFLSSIESDDADIKREMEDSGKSVRVMTTHGAKGLEAHVVILADTAGAPDTREQSGIIVSGGEVFWSPKKDADDEATAIARAAVAAAAEREQARLLYVAMTRARDRLIVCGAALGNIKEGRAAASWHAHVEDGLRRMDAAECETPFGAGLRWGAPTNVKADARGDARDAPLPAWLFEPAPQEGPAPRTLAPSRLKPDEAPIFSARASGRSRFKRGRLIHGLLERLPDMAPSAREKAARDWLKGRGIEGKDAKKLAEEALSVIAHPDFAGVFAPGSRAEVPIVGVTATGQRIAGAIDRLAVTDSEILALDFKTDRPAPLDPDNIPGAYVAQMAAYAAVLRTTFPNRRIRCAILWTEKPVLMEISPELLARSGLG
jgi:ATP-dependent helicase/nuclease subunit A